MGAEITRFVRESVRAFVREMLEVYIEQVKKTLKV